MKNALVTKSSVYHFSFLFASCNTYVIRVFKTNFFLQLEFSLTELYLLTLDAPSSESFTVCLIISENRQTCTSKEIHNNCSYFITILSRKRTVVKISFSASICLNVRMVVHKGNNLFSKRFIFNCRNFNNNVNEVLLLLNLKNPT